MKNSRNYALLLLAAVVLMAVAVACVRSAPLASDEDPGQATEKVAQTADAQIQQTLDALLGQATVDSAPTSTPTPLPTATEPAVEPTATLEAAQLTALAAALTPTATLAETTEATPTATGTVASATAPCYAARYVYDETYPDGTRVNPGQAMAKTWRLQNVGTCDWRAGQYELFFVGGNRMNGSSPLTITYGVPAGGYANFTINLVAPPTPGTHRGEWVLRFDGTQQVGVGPDYNLPIWIEVIVRGE
ncbi:MAG: hypothetical protein KIT08_03010 [Anaerolineales bacterium]|nr:MAG: hypothetical protein KIT08_03010 [Anaerolineales bacterium]